MSERKDYIYDPFLPSPMGFGQRPQDPKEPNDPNMWLILVFLALLSALAYCDSLGKPTSRRHDSGPEISGPFFIFTRLPPGRALNRW